MDDTLTHSHNAESGPLARAQILFDLGRHREVLDTLRPHIHEDEDGRVSAYLLCSSSLRVLGDYTAARTLTQEGLTLYPQNTSLHIELARALLGQSLTQAALEEAKRAVALDPEWSETHAVESGVLYEMGRYPESVESIRRALALDPNNANFHLRLAANLYHQDLNQAALASVNAGLALDPNHAELLGMLARIEPNRRKKLDLLRSALRLNPSHERHQYLHGLLTRLFLRDLAFAVAFTLLHLATKFLLPADWLWAYESAGAIVIWVVGTALLRFTPQHFKLVVGFNFLNIAIGISPDDAAAVWPNLMESGIGSFLAMSVALLIMAYIGAIIMGIVRSLLSIPIVSLYELVQASREAKRANVTPTFLRELVHSRNVWFNLAGFFPPLIAPLFAPSWAALAGYLILAQPLLLYAVSRLWLPKGRQIGFVMALFLHGIPLIFIIAGKNIPPATTLDGLLIGLGLALIGFITADILRRIA